MPAYVVGVLNAGRRRGVIDIRIYASIKFTGLQLYPDSPPAARYILHIPNNIDNIVRLDPMETPYRLVQLDLITAVRGASAGIATLLDRYNVAVESESLLEDLLSLGKAAYLKVDLLCHDEWSGARKHYESIRYGLDDIVLGKFEHRGRDLVIVSDPASSSAESDATEGQ